MRIDGKVAIVTGGGGSLGTTCSLALAEGGAAVVVAGRTLEKCEQTARRVRDLGGRAIALQVDVTSPEDVERMVAGVLAEYGTIDILLNNAGIGMPTLMLDSDPKEWMRVVHVNVNGTFLCTQVVSRVMARNKSGRIINMGSVAGGAGVARCSAYSASKAAIINLTKSLALELGTYRITVNTIAPSVIQTEFNREFFKKQPDFYDRILDRAVLGRFGVPEDLMGILVFLSSEAASYITGQTIYVDGGYMAA
jgi:NAD(P)-dependent dehydrogenase (short-subunit alcohol dehydrogenase family)